MDKYRYNNVAERYSKVNRFFLIAAYLLYFVFILYLFIAAKEGKVTMQLAVIESAVLILLDVVNAIVLIGKKASVHYKFFMAIEVVLVYIVISFTTPASFLGLALVGILGVSIPYYDHKYFMSVFIANIVIYSVCQILRLTGDVVQGDSSSICNAIMIYAMFIVMWRIGIICKAFSDHALGAVEEQKDKQERMLGEIIEISQTVKTESDTSKEMMGLLLDSATRAARSMQEIASAADLTAGNIATQTSMTQDIQDAIEETKERSKEMVAIATNSNEDITYNKEMMEKLLKQSQQITETNHQVTDSMEKLQNKTKEAEDIAAMILNISGQTNLLALNASIESARAGEAGRGFAVVAEQIRQLAEETRHSTESITEIITELNANAQAVVQAVETSVTATESQNEMIEKTADSFGRLNQDMTKLITDINEIDAKIEELSDANNQIVDNISQISATTQEVTASASQTTTLSEKNVEYAQNTQTAISMIQESTSKLEQYI